MVEHASDMTDVPHRHTSARDDTPPAVPCASGVGDLDRDGGVLPAARSAFRELGRSRRTEVARLGTRRPGRVLVELVGDPDAPARPAAQHRASSTWRSWCPTAPTWPGAAPRDRRRLAVHGRLGSPRERGALPRRSRGQRHRDLPRPPARGVATRRDGELEMATLPLDLEGVLGARAGRDAGRGHARRHADGPRPPAGARPRRRRGASTPPALGFDVTVRSYPGALFVSAGRLPPPPRAQHLGHAAAPAAPAGRARAAGATGWWCRRPTTCAPSRRAWTRPAWPPSRATGASRSWIRPGTGHSWRRTGTDGGTAG